MITGMNESKILAKQILSKCKCRFDVTKCNANKWWSNNKCRKERKKITYVNNIMFGILQNVIVKMENI